MKIGRIILLSLCVLSVRVAQGAPASPIVLIGTIDEDKLTAFRQSKPLLVTQSINRVALTRKLSAVFSTRVLWLGPNTKMVNVTNEVLANLGAMGVKPIQTPPVATIAPGLDQDQKVAAKAALKALRKLAAATEVGVNNRLYGERLIDTKAEVNENLQEIPIGVLKTEIQAAMDAYADAASIWNDSFEYKYIAVLLVGPPGDIIKKYSIKVDTYQGDLRETTQEDRNLILSTIWGAAKEHTDKASALSGR